MSKHTDFRFGSVRFGSAGTSGMAVPQMRVCQMALPPLSTVFPHSDDSARCSQPRKSQKPQGFTFCCRPPVPLLPGVAQLAPVRLQVRSPSSVELTS